MTFDEYLKEVRARLEAATPGPWEVDSDWYAKVDSVDSIILNKEIDTLELKPADAALIANAPTDIARLLQAVEMLREAIYKIHTNSALTFLEATKFAGMSGLSRDTFMKAHMGHLDFLRDKALAELDEI